MKLCCIKERGGVENKNIEEYFKGEDTKGIIYLHEYENGLKFIDERGNRFLTILAT